MPTFISFFLGIVPSTLAFLALLVHASPAEAQIKQPGAHPMYSVELEPHLMIQHDRGWGADGEGIGPGLRITIPVIQNGPIRTINNSLGIGFGIDWAMFDGCEAFFNDESCEISQVWLPVVAQWNFFFTPVISVFGEVGGSIVHRELSDRRYCGVNESDCSDSDLDLFEPVFFAGARFLFTRNFGLLVRLGTPYISIGADFVM